MKRVFALAGLTLLAAPALADTSVIASVMDSRIEAGTLDASPLALAVELRHELSEYFYAGGQVAFGIDEDSAAANTDLGLDSAWGLNLGAQLPFSHYAKGYAFVGLSNAEVSLTATGPGGASGSADGLATAFGIGATFRVGKQGLIDVGWTSLYDDDMDTAGGGNVDVAIDGLHVGYGLTF